MPDRDRLDRAPLDERVVSALHGLSGRVAFSGLRRVLQAHPESLARSLRRLEREGLVEKIDGTYRIRDDGQAPPADPELSTIAHVELPTGAEPEGLLGHLAGRWFGSLRWVGVLDRPGGPLLAWARRDGPGLVLLGREGSQLTVYVPEQERTADPHGAEDAAYDLLLHATEALRPLGRSFGLAAGGSVRAFELGPGLAGEN
jgi:hypothetical protein